MHGFKGFTSYFYFAVFILSGITKVAAGAPSKLVREVARREIPTPALNSDPCWNNILCSEGDSSVGSRTKNNHERGKRSSGRKKWKKDYEFISNNITKKDDDSWPSLQDIFDQVHRNLSHWRKEEMIDYNWPYYYNFPTFETDIIPTTEKPKSRTQEEDFMSKFVFRKIDTSSFKQSILAISVRNPPTSRKKQETKKQWVQVTTVPTPPNNHTRHLKRLHEHLKAISAAKARLHHRWLQKEKIQSKLLT